MNTSADVLIVGSGAAGLTAALNLAETHKVAVIAKGALGEGATGWAQGGIAAVLEEGDSFEAHIEGHDDRRRRPQRSARSSSMSSKQRRARSSGWPSLACRSATRRPERWHLTREGGHSHRRIVHVADATGWAVQQALETRRGEAPEHHPGPRHGRDRPRHRPPCDAILDERRSPRPLRLQPRRTKRVETLTAQGDDPRHRRRGPGLPLFDRAARRDRRRHRHGVAGGLPRLQHGVHAVPPDLPLQSARSRIS